jgi:hypothetical protein
MAVIPVYLLLLVVAGLGMGQVGRFFVFFCFENSVFSRESTVVFACCVRHGTGTIFVCFVHDIVSLVISCMFYFCLQFF